jgi:magnesium-transporting ATPase (P-type)
VANIAAVIREARRTVAQMRAADPAAEFGLALHSEAWKRLDDADDGPTSKTKAGRKDRKANKKLVAHTPAEAALQQSTLSAFFDRAASCRSALASRLEPREKAAVAEEMRRRTGRVCLQLAIGDGNNDEQVS